MARRPPGMVAEVVPSSLLVKEERQSQLVTKATVSVKQKVKPSLGKHNDAALSIRKDFSWHQQWGCHVL